MRGATLCLLAAAACGGAAPPASSPTPSPEAAAPSTRPAYTVSAVVLANGCARFGVDNGRLAQAAMSQLVEGCSTFTDDRVVFTATLLPGGAIQFEPRPDGSQTIPLCVLNHPLTHKVKLQKACSLDVQLEKGSVAVPNGPDAGADAGH
jgi:hypothetical protein